MSITKLIIASSLCLSTLAFAEDTKDNQRNWTIHAAEQYATKGNTEKKPVVTDPGVLVTSQRDPQDKR